MKQSALILVLALTFPFSWVYGQTPQTQTVALRQGWNLVSFRILPDNPTPARVLSGLSADPAAALTAIWAYDETGRSWKQWVPGNLLNTDSVSGIQSFVYHRGYWIHATQPNLTLTVTGYESPDGVIRFAAGWNLFGFPSGERGAAGLAQVDAVFRAHVQGVDPDVDLIYAVAADGTLLRWDFTIDRRTGDFNADGMVTAADQTFKSDFNLPDDDPALTETTPNPDAFVALLSGAGYWVHARRGFDLTPLLKTAVAADIDNVPQNNFPGPEDFDLDRDGLLDVGSWSAPAPLTGTNQAGIYVQAGQKTTQIILNNVGQGILRWQVTFVPGAQLATLSQQAVAVAPDNGETLTDTDTITLTVNRTGLPPGTYEGDLKVESNGGTRVFRVYVGVPELVGDFRGVATIDTVDGKRVTLPAIDLGLSLFRSPDDTLRGQIRSDISAHFPLPVSVQGELIAVQNTAFTMIAGYGLPRNAILARAPGTLNFTVEERPDANAVSHVGTINPFPRPIFRELVLIGERSRDDVALTGTFHDTLLGVTASPIRIQGTFELVRESLEPSGQPTAGSGSPCSIIGLSNQAIPEGTEKLFRLNGVLGCTAITQSVLIDSVRVYVRLTHPNKGQLRIRLLSPTESASDPNAGVLLYDGQQAGGPTLLYPDLSWPFQFSPALQGLFPQEGPAALEVAYRGQRSDQGNGEWRLGITDQVADGSNGLLTQWLVSFVGPTVYRLSGQVVDSASNSLAGVVVTLTGAEVLHSAVTGDDGKFTFDSLPPYRYRVAAYKPGYRVLASDTLKVDLLGDFNMPEPIRLELLSPVLFADLLITPPSGRVSEETGSFACTLGYVARAFFPGDTHQFVVQRYGKDPVEPNPGDPGFTSGLRAPVPVGSPILVPATPGPNPFVTVRLSEAGVYSVAAVVYRGGLQVRRVEEPSPKALQRYTIRVETLPAGLTDGRQIFLADGVFSSGGVVPFEFYPPTTPPGQNLSEPPAAFVPVGAGNPATHNFSYRLDEDGAAQYVIRLGEDMARSVSVDWNGPEGGPGWDGPAWDPASDPWRVNNPELIGRDLNVAEPLVANPTHDFGRPPIRDVGWITYDLLPGDGAPAPIRCLQPFPDDPQRCYVMTCSLGSSISGRSAGLGLVLEGGARLTWPRTNVP